MFLTGDLLSKTIKDLLKEEGVRCAVAFWGAGSEDLVAGPGAQIICNLRSGGTNPFALRRIKGAEIRQCDELHAKVYLGHNLAVVTSANASANGLGLEGGEQARWTEAGVSSTDAAAIGTWFDALWNSDEVRPISDPDWEAAEVAWRDRQRAKPSPATFATFNTDADDLPLMSWSVHREWEQSDDEVKAQLGFSDENTRRWIEEGVDVDASADEEVLKGKWVLLWERGPGGSPVKGGSPWWAQLSGTVVRDGFRYLDEAEKRTVMLGVDRRTPQPFDPSEPLFVAALAEVIARAEYRPLRELRYEGAWFAPRLELIRQCWRDVKLCYLRRAAEKHPKP